MRRSHSGDMSGSATCVLPDDRVARSAHLAPDQCRQEDKEEAGDNAAQGHGLSFPLGWRMKRCPEESVAC